MRQCPKWVNDLFAEPEESTDRTSPSYANTDQIKKFLADNFSEEEKKDDGIEYNGESTANNYVYILKKTNIEFTKEQIQRLTLFMKTHHFDGVIYDTTYMPNTENAAIR